jgi:hypothetical protein
MSGTLPSANKPSLGGRVLRAAAKTTLGLGSAAFNKMFPVLGPMMGRGSSSRDGGSPTSINMSSEDISRGLFTNVKLTRTILQNQIEQNRLLERLLLVYTDKNLPDAISAAPPPPPAGGNVEIDMLSIPMPDLPDRRQPPRPQPAQQRPSAASRAASAVRAGARIAARFAGAAAFLLIVTQGLSRLGEQSVWLSSSRRARLTRTITALEANIADYQRKLEELQNEDDEQKAAELGQDLETLLQAITVQRDSIVSMAAELDADMTREMSRRRRGATRPPAGFTFTESVAQLVGQASALVPQAAEQAPTPEPPAVQELVSTAGGVAAATASAAAVAAEAAIPAVRVEGNSIAYDFESVKFEANLIKFDGLTLRTPAAAAEPMATAASTPSATAPTTPPTAGAAAAAQPSNIATQPPPQSPMIQTMLGGRGGQPAAAGTPNTGSAAAAMQFFQSRGWTPAQAAGFAANLQVESNFNPAAVGDGGRAYGIAQWHPDRQAAFQRWAGRDIRGSTFEQQLEFMQFELTQGNERRAGTMIRQATTPEQAAAMVDQYYERSNGHARQRRMQLAASYAGNIPVTAGQQPVQSPASSAPALAQASTERVVADREQMRNTQILLDTFNARLSQRPGQPNEQAAGRQAKKQEQGVGEVPLRSRILEAFNYLTQAS